MSGHKPERMCVICRQRFGKEILVRYILGQEGIFILDEKRLLPGRGWYCCTKSTCMAKFANFRPKRRNKPENIGKSGQGAI